MTWMDLRTCSCSWETLAAAVHVFSRGKGMYCHLQSKATPGLVLGVQGTKPWVWNNVTGLNNRVGRRQPGLVVSSVNPDLRTRHGRAVRWGRLCGRDQHL